MHLRQSLTTYVKEFEPTHPESVVDIYFEAYPPAHLVFATI